MVDAAWAVDDLMIESTDGLILDANLTVGDLFAQTSVVTRINGNNTLTTKRFEVRGAAVVGTGTLAAGANGGSFSVLAATTIEDVSITLAAGSTSTIAAGFTMSSGSLTNAGTLSWTDGNILMGGATQITNTATGTFDAKSDRTMTSGKFTNNGSFIKSAGGISGTIVSALFDNQGAAANVWSKVGIIEFANNGTHTGTFKADLLAVVAFTNGTATLNQGTTFTGDGAIGIAGSGFNTNFLVPANVTIVSNCHIGLAALGTITATGTFRSMKSMYWVGGTITGAGQFDAHQTVRIFGNDFKDLMPVTFNNHAATTFEGAGSLTFTGATWNNHSSFEIQNDTAIGNGGGNSQFNNLLNAAVVKTAGVDRTLISVNFSNAGTLDLNGYRLGFDGPAVFSQSATGLTDLGGGTLWVTAQATFTLNGGVLQGDGTIEGNLVNQAGAVVVGGTLFTPILTITGNYTQGANAILKIGISTGPIFGLLDVGGTATIAGDVQVFSVDGTVPAANTERDILTAGTLNGTFGPNPAGYQLSYPANQNKVVLKKT